MGTKRKSGQFRDLFCCPLGKLWMGVESGADCRSSDGKVIQAFESLLQASDVALQQTRPASKLLTHCQRNRVLQMRASDLYDSFEFLRLGGNRIADRLY